MKRYKHGHVCGTTYYGCCAEESEDGDFILYNDYIAERNNLLKHIADLHLSFAAINTVLELKQEEESNTSSCSTCRYQYANMCRECVHNAVDHYSQKGSYND